MEHLGVTPPISCKPPTDEDRASTAALVTQLKTINALEDQVMISNCCYLGARSVSSPV